MLAVVARVVQPPLLVVAHRFLQSSGAKRAPRELRLELFMLFVMRYTAVLTSD